MESSSTDQPGLENYQEKDVPASWTQVPWTGWDVWFGFGLFILWNLVAVGFSIGREVYGWKIDIGVFIGLWELVLLLPAWFFSVRKYNLSWRALGLRSFAYPSLAIGCGLMILSSCFNIFYNLGSSLFRFNEPLDLTNLFDSLATPWPLLIAGVLVAPFVEEVFFRGFVFAGFREEYGWVPAALISSGLFAAAHLQPASMLPIFLLGMIFAYLYHRTNSIWPAVIMHLATNALGLGAAYLISQMDLPNYQLSILVSILLN